MSAIVKRIYKITVKLTGINDQLIMGDIITKFCSL